MIYLKSDEEIELLRNSNLIVAKTLAELAKIIAPGVSTLRLNNRADEFIRDNGEFLISLDTAVSRVQFVLQ